jgi:hypothetical protein
VNSPHLIEGERIFKVHIVRWGGALEIQSVLYLNF